jgi:sugar/nucleoside kinase (ribokinase family)
VTVTVVGSVAFDSLETPFGKRERVLGGAATHFSVAASYFTDVRLVAVVGDDFGQEELQILTSRNVNVDDLERVAGGRSFHWSGRYDEDMTVAHTLDTQLNVFADFDPQLSEESRSASVLFLANILPNVQKRVREQCRDAFCTGLDSMNYWIESARDALLEAIAAVDVVTLNDAEVRMLTEEPNLARAARRLRELGPRVALVKQGPYGACMFTDDGYFSIPAYPLETVLDPTGAGDAFAGGFFGFVDSAGDAGLSEATLRRAAVYGSVMASFIVEDFGSERLLRLRDGEIETRFSEFRRMMTLDDVAADDSARAQVV